MTISSHEDYSSIPFGELLTKSFPPTHHIIQPGLLSKGSILIIGGPPKTYKSFVLTDLLISLATGTPLWGATRSPGGGRTVPAFPISSPKTVLYIEQEVGEMDLQERLLEMVKYMPPQARELCNQNIRVRSCDRRIRLDDPEGTKRLAHVIHDANSPDIVALDPLIEFHGSDENSAQEMAYVFHHLDMLRETFGFASLINHHTTKPVKDNPRKGPDLLRGSSVIFGKGDSYIIIDQPDRRKIGRLVLDFTLRRGKPIGSLRLKLNLDTLRMEFDGWTKANEEEKESKVTSIDGLLDSLSGEPVEL